MLVLRILLLIKSVCFPMMYLRLHENTPSYLPMSRTGCVYIFSVEFLKKSPLCRIKIFLFTKRHFEISRLKFQSAIDIVHSSANMNTSKMIVGGSFIINTFSISYGRVSRKYCVTVNNLMFLSG